LMSGRKLSSTAPCMNRKTFGLIAIAAAGLLGAACETPTHIPCEPISNVTASLSGDTTVTTSGLRYRELRVGSGTQVITHGECQRVRIDFEARLPAGTVIDNRSDYEFKVGDGTHLAGLEQGMVGMRVGGRRQLIIPPALGYGSSPSPNVPANSTLIVDVELVAVGGL
jgi:peptidylprolyl isomerase